MTPVLRKLVDSVRVGALLLLLLAPAAAWATARGLAKPPPDALLCRERIARIERAEGLPAGLLQAIALAESGRWDAERRALLPWPWTVNAGGEAAYLASKEEAVRHVARLRAQGRTNIDVGCLQINLGWHPAAFPDLETAFDPESNAAYAAAFLATLREEAGSWQAAVERYHSRDPERGPLYRERVWRHWAAAGYGGGAGDPPIAEPAGPVAPPPPVAGRAPAAPEKSLAEKPLALTPVRDAAIERAALQSVNRLAARQTWRWLQLQASLPGGPIGGPPAAILAALDPAAAEPAAGAMVPTALLPRPLVFAGPSRTTARPAPGRIPGLVTLRPDRPARPAAAPAPPPPGPAAGPPRRLASAS